MKLGEKIEGFVDVFEESEADEVKRRMRAALRIGARVALEHVLLTGGGYTTKSDIEKAIKELSDDYQRTSASATPAPLTVYPPAEEPAAPPLVVDRDVNVDQPMPPATLGDDIL